MLRRDTHLSVQSNQTEKCHSSVVRNRVSKTLIQFRGGRRNLSEGGDGRSPKPFLSICACNLLAENHWRRGWTNLKRRFYLFTDVNRKCKNSHHFNICLELTFRRLSHGSFPFIFEKCKKNRFLQRFSVSMNRGDNDLY